ncbi:MAG: hypothetical protein QNK03_00905 [Myxococcota bacterium]|nr:hypothetical protein [Myxococcota bacterium]
MSRAPELLAGLVLGVAASAGTALAAEPLERTTTRGPVTATVRLSPAEPLIGDALVLELEVVAAPEVELLLPEFGEALDEFAIVDFAPFEGLDDQGRSVAVQRYTLQAARSGPQRLPPLLIEFVDRRPDQTPAPEDADAYELLTERLDFEVRSVLPEDAAVALRPPAGALEPRGAGRGWLWAGLAGVLALGAGALAWRAALARRARAARRSAYDLAVERLEQLVAGARDDVDAFYVELSDIVRRYLEARFELRSPELTTEEFLDVMAGSRDLDEAQKAQLREFLSGADLVKFAQHVPGPEAIDGAVAGARSFLDQTRPAPEAARA